MPAANRADAAQALSSRRERIKTAAPDRKAEHTLRNLTLTGIGEAASPR
jgi:hypothetical protein